MGPAHASWRSLARLLQRAGQYAAFPLAAASADAADTTATLPPVQVTSTQIVQPAFDTPASVDVIDGRSMRDSHLQVNLSESLGSVPGLLIQNRQNYAQDLQLSLRGFGARSTFGVRGVRLYVDGIPATMPDGQGQTSNIDIASIDRVEVLRGPFSALHGNSSGGVVSVTTEDGDGPARITSSFAAGSDGQRRYGLKASGSAGDAPQDFRYLLSTNRYLTDGYREHSAARKTLANAKLGIGLGADNDLTLVFNSVDLAADDPQGLTRQEFEDDPRSAAPGALRFDTRKTVRQTQGGAVYEHRVDNQNALRLMLYYGQRDTRQFLSIPVATQAAPGQAGGVIDLRRDYGGADLRWTWQSQLAARPFTMAAGLAYDTMTEDRRGYENFVQTAQGPQLGVQGKLRRKERNRAWNLDPYLQASWQFAPAWTLEAGLRYSTVRFDSQDQYITPGNADDSGSARYRKALPMAALRYQVNPGLNLYATAGRGFETPTFNELSYRPDGQPGLNFGLQPSVNTSIEAGAKAHIGQGTLTAALFQTRTADEIAVDTSQDGRTTYQNAGRTRRQGAELRWTATLARHWRAALAYTWLDARYRDGFHDGAPTPDNRVAAGNRIPGIAQHAAYVALAWAPPKGWRAGIEGRYLGAMYADDRNQHRAPGYFTAAVHAGYAWSWQDWQFDAFARLDNVFDRHYVGSVIVNAGQDRYYEPAPGRTWIAGLGATYQF
ncbi:TonB-dependent receptor [Bordetella sp. BOR01]|uniref:TonB-dependent receptor n=1 Tax=Bordetella sp. BOR01 TaxID=2854779 RepID=UPI001C447AA4|nr:TonB-dependent receptor [Bordetella sp. BOR01]MBV7483700.1 TonB-dependent receptor [Bordetella sp. BOR01]